VNWNCSRTSLLGVPGTVFRRLLPAQRHCIYLLGVFQFPSWYSPSICHSILLYPAAAIAVVRSFLLVVILSASSPHTSQYSCLSLGCSGRVSSQWLVFQSLFWYFPIFYAYSEQFFWGSAIFGSTWFCLMYVCCSSALTVLPSNGCINLLCCCALYSVYSAFVAAYRTYFLCGISERNFTSLCRSLLFCDWYFHLGAG
jgi:hypothetical protein